MADAAPLRSTLRPVDGAALQRIRRRLQNGTAPWLHGEVARRMAERLPVILVQPTTVIDWWPQGDTGAQVLRAAYPKARQLRALAPEQTPPPPPAWLARQLRREAPAVPAGALSPAAGQMLWANMSLHWCADPQAEMRHWHRALAVDGFLMFSTFGPGTLDTLRALYRELGWPPPHAPFVDMHDLGDMLVEAGFADPVMDQETLTLNWPDAPALLAELRSLGANADPARFAGLRTPHWREALCQRLQPDPAQRPALSFELVYGHAFRPRPRPKVAAQTQLPLDDMRSILRSRPER